MQTIHTFETISADNTLTFDQLSRVTGGADVRRVAIQPKPASQAAIDDMIKHSIRQFDPRVVGNTFNGG